MIEVRDKLSGELLDRQPLPVGQRLVDWLAEHIDHFERRERPPISVTLNGNLLLQSRWDRVIRAGDVIVICPEPKAAAGVFILKAIATAAVSYAVSALTAPKISDNYNSTIPDSSSIYSPNAQGNTPRLNGVVSELFGIHKNYPDTVSAPWRYYEDDDQYLMLLLGCGVGRYQFNEINIGNTPVSRYADDIDYQIFEPGEVVTGHPAHRNIYTSSEVGGTTSGGMELLSDEYSETGVKANSSVRYTITSPNKIVSTITSRVRTDHDQFENQTNPYPLPFAVDDLVKIDNSPIDGVYKIISLSGNVARFRAEDGSALSWSDSSDQTFSMKGVEAGDAAGAIGPFLACPSSTVTGLVMLDFYHPGGLANVGESVTERTLTVEISWREVGTSSWNSVEYTKTANTLDDIGYTFEIPLDPPITPEVQVKRVTEKSDDQAVRDTVHWQALRAELPAATSYPGMTVMAVKIRGTNALSASAENKFNTVQHRKLPVYKNNEWRPETLTSGIGPVFSYIIKNCGHPDERIALNTLSVLHNIWQARGDEFNGVFDTDSTLFAALERVLAVGYASPIVKNGAIDIIRKVARDAWGQTFSDDNTLSITESGTLFDPDEPDGVTVEYFDSETWQSATVTCLLSGDAGVFPEEVRAYGVTDRLAAWRYGMRVRRARRYIRQTYEVETELEGLNAELGDKCSLPGRACQSGWCEAYDSGSRQMTVSRDLDAGASGQYYMTIRRPDGTMSDPYPVTLVSPRVVELGSDLGFSPDVSGAIVKPLFKFGLWSGLHVPATVETITPSGDTVSLELSIYDERLWADDDSDLPEYAQA